MKGNSANAERWTLADQDELKQRRSELQEKRNNEAGRLLRATPYSPEAALSRKSLDEIDRQLAQLPRPRTQLPPTQLSPPPHPISLPTRDPARLEKHAQVLAGYRDDYAKQLEKAKPGSRKARGLKRQIESLNREIEPYFALLQQPSVLKSLEEPSRQQRRPQAALDILKGLGLLILGGLATLIGYIFADPGESYFLFWGAMAIGMFLLLRGVGLRQGWW